MKDLEKQIEEASYSYISGFHENKDKRSIGEAFRRGAKSEAAKEYWQQGMYSEKEVYDLCYSAMKQTGYATLYDINKWFEQNKKK